MTIHSAKGLEFPVVFLAGLEENLLPHRNSADRMQIEEERRLLYVAITRAKELLYMSYANERGSGYTKRQSEASRFIQELPTIGIELHSRQNPRESGSDQKVKTLKRLGSLREKIQKGFH